MKLVGLALSAAMLGQVGCGSGAQTPTTPSAPDAHTPPAAVSGDAGQLSTLADVLARNYKLTVLRGSDLPRKKVIAPSSQGKNLPTAPKAVAGLRVDLPGRRDAFVLRFETHQIASSAAASYLKKWGDGVSGCGAQIWFSNSRNPTAVDWGNTVRVTLRKTDPACSKQMFGVIS